MSDWHNLVETFSTSPEYRNRVGLAELANIDLTLYNRTRHGFWFPVKLSSTDTLKEHAFYDYERDECNAIARLVKRGDVCVDLGARYGFMSCLMAQLVGPAGIVYAFEPGDGSDLLETALDANQFRQVRLMREAAFDTNGMLSYSKGAAQLDAIAGTISVPAVRLDDRLRDRARPINFMKIDIEGAEYRALHGAQDIMTNDRPTILMELFEEYQQKVSGVSVHELLRFMRSNGYDVQTLADEPFADDEIRKLMDDNVVVNAVFHPQQAR